MEFISEQLLDYCENFTEPESGLLKELNRQTHLKVSSPRMLSGHLQGRFLALISKLIAPQNILEIGTYTGYSALCLAEGLSQSGTLYTIDPNEETNHFAQGFFKRSDLGQKIKLVQGQASAILPGMDVMFDLVFIDADKKNYALYFDLVVDKVRPGGIIIADNVLWSGKVLDAEMDAETQSLHDYNKKVSTDKRVKPFLLPLRDGLMLLQKI